jgi:hypothetical protein
MRPDEIAYLDETSLAIRKSAQAAVSRSALLRAFVRAIQHQNVTFPAATDETDVARRVVNLLAAGMKTQIVAQPTKSSTNPPSPPRA